MGAPMNSDPAAAIVDRCLQMVEDLDMGSVVQWKKKTGRKAIGCLPGYAPHELIHAAGFLPVGIVGGGEGLEITRGDAYFQSYICHLPRSVVELGVGGKLNCLDGFVFPSTCDVIRNLSGMWQLLFEGRYVKYLDVPQNFVFDLGGRFFLSELKELAEGLEGLGGEPITDDRLRASLAIYDKRRAVMEQAFTLRSNRPEVVPSWELYLLMRVGNVVAVEDHIELVEQWIAAVSAREGRVRDNPRVVLQGAFCEQPPVDLIKTLERAGCYIVEDDFSQQQRWIKGAALNGEADPWKSLVKAFLERSRPSSIRYQADSTPGQELIATVKRTNAEGVVFASPSFCDPSLLDLPMLTSALDGAGVPWTSFKYAENTGQFQTIREQAGTFSDSIRLWSEA